MTSRNLKDFRTLKIEPKDVKELRRLVKNKKIPLGNIIVS